MTADPTPAAQSATHELAKNPHSNFLDTIRDVIAARYGFWVQDLWFEKLEKVVAQRMGRRGARHQPAYLDLLTASARGEDNELQELTEELLIGETSFHRNPPQFDALQKIVLPELLRLRTYGRIRIASFGCSTGEEPYSVAIAALETLGPEAASRLEVVGIDARRRALTRAREGRYSELQLREYDDARRERWFTRNGREFEVRQSLRECVRFLCANLADPLPLTGIDVVFCRNVMIYFQKPFIATLMQSFHGAMNPGGYLFLGHAETASDYRDLFHVVYTDETYFFRRRGVTGPPAPQ